MPPEAKLPLVMIDGEVVINGGKIAIPLINRKIEEILEKATLLNGEHHPS